MRCGGEHESKDCSLDWCEEKCTLGCDLYHAVKDCPKNKFGNNKAGRQSRPTSKMVYKRYKSPSGRSTSFTRNDKGDRYRDMSSPGGSKYREYRNSSRDTSRDRSSRWSKGNQNGARRSSSTGRKPDGNYRVHSLGMEEKDQEKDEYNNAVFSSINMYPTCPDFSNPN